MRQCFLLPCVVVAAVGLSGCGGGSSSSAAAESSAVRANGIAAVAAGNSSPAVATARTSQLAGGSSSASTSGKPVVALVDGHGNPVIPVAARAHTDAGAIAFTKYYWALLDYLDQYPRKGLLPKFSMPTCDTCRKAEVNIEDSAKTGSHQIGNSSILSSFHIQHSPSGNEYLMNFFLDVSSSTLMRRGLSAEHDSAASFKTAAVLKWGDEGWQMLAFGSDSGVAR